MPLGPAYRVGDIGLDAAQHRGLEHVPLPRGGQHVVPGGEREEVDIRLLDVADGMVEDAVFERYEGVLDRALTRRMVGTLRKIYDWSPPGR